MSWLEAFLGAVAVVAVAAVLIVFIWKALQ